MATLESIREADERQREAEERNPLLKLKLGELVREMQIIVAKDPNVLTSKSSWWFVRAIFFFSSF